MTNIESYLSGALPYAELTDAERCAICAAMEGGWPWIQEEGDVYPGTVWNRYVDSRGEYGLRYEIDGTAALRLVERFGLWLIPIKGQWVVESCVTDGGLYASAEAGTPSAAIVACMCEIAKAEWPYKEMCK